MSQGGLSRFQPATFFHPREGLGTHFPQFLDGDVRIVISGARQYQLHKSILVDGSPTFKKLLADEYTTKLSSKAIKKNILTRNRLMLEKTPYDGVEGNSPIRTLVPIALDEEGKPINGPTVGLDLENGMMVDPLHLAYEAVLGAFYNRPLDLGGTYYRQPELAEVLDKGLAIVGVAEYLGVVDMITNSVEVALLACGQDLYRSIANNPAAWLDFASRLKSFAVYREAFIHAVGQFNTEDMTNAMKTTLSAKVVRRLEYRAGQMKEGIKAAQLNMLSYYPPELMRETTTGHAEIDHISRTSYSNDIMRWLALTTFRHFFSQNVASDHTHHASDMGFGFFEMLATGGDSYLSRPDLVEFHRYFPMTAKGALVMETRLGEIKDYIRTIAMQFMAHTAQINKHNYPTKYFTYANVIWSDYPWVTVGDPVEDEYEEGDDTSWVATN